MLHSIYLGLRNKVSFKVTFKVMSLNLHSALSADTGNWQVFFGGITTLPSPIIGQLD